MRLNSTAMAKARGISLHVGVNALDPEHYAGWKGELQACEHDALDMAAVAEASGMKPQVLLTKQATRSNVLSALESAGKRLKAGDLFFLSFSGFGSQVPDVSGDELDMMDESWCLHDAQVIDDEVQSVIRGFGKGVRVLVIADSSPSGSVHRPHLPDPDPPPRGQRAKLVAPLLATKIYRMHGAFYDALQRSLPKPPARGSRPAVIVLHGCQHNQAAIDRKDGGVFTRRLMQVWNQGSYRGNYVRFFARVVARMPATQTPMMRTVGLVDDFVLQEPFAV